jgi:hypothetical protein
METPSSFRSRVFSLTFARGLRRRVDYDGGAEVDLIYSIVAAGAVKGEVSLDLIAKKCNCWK